MICVLNDLIVRVRVSNERHEYRVAADGNETGEPLRVVPAADWNSRMYICTKCGVCEDGSESFDEIRKHLGKFHEVHDPFEIKKNPQLKLGDDLGGKEPKP